MWSRGDRRDCRDTPPGAGDLIQTSAPGARWSWWLKQLQLLEGRKHGLQLCGKLHRRQPLLLVLIQ